MRLRGIAALVTLLTIALTGSAAPASSERRDTTIEIVGAFVVGIPITGAVLHEGYLYVTTSERLSIYDVSDPVVPQLMSSVLSPRSIYGELLSTDGGTLLLNNGFAGGTVDIWDVEDKTNPVLAATARGVSDEHVSCVLDCRWAYGSDGSILDLRRLDRRSLKTSVNWKQVVGFNGAVHRLDEFRWGYMATAPRAASPFLLDVRRPLKPRVIGKTRVKSSTRSAYLYTYWPRKGQDDFVISSTELGRCDEEHQGALMTFDARRWPARSTLPVADTYRYRGRTDSSDNRCTSYYFSLHPKFRNGGLVLVPNGFEGVRVVAVDRAGKIEEVDSFTAPVSDMWLAFWIDDEIFYTLNRTGEAYILRYQ